MLLLNFFISNSSCEFCALEKPNIIPNNAPPNIKTNIIEAIIVVTLCALPIGLLFAKLYRFNPLIERGFNVDTSAGWVNLHNSGL